MHRVFGDRQVWRGGERTKASALKWGKSEKKIISSYKNVLSLFTVFFTTMRRTFTGRSHPVKQTWRPWKRNKRPFSSVDSKTRIRWNSGLSARFQIFTSEELKPYHHGISVLLVGNMKMKTAYCLSFPRYFEWKRLYYNVTESSRHIVRWHFLLKYPIEI